MLENAPKTETFHEFRYKLLTFADNISYHVIWYNKNKLHLLNEDLES